ncbi:MAG: hypothetical protein EHM16_12765 [Betaproteobacteria bacterium]|nr:MAG: hypothetical protein EHM16_12765 [Betaproteobacteria bacterium]
MTRTPNFRRWLVALLLVLGGIAASPQARAQMPGEFNTDIVILDGALAETVAAAGKANQDASRVAMEELYRLWRLFREKNFDAQAGDPLFVPDMEKVEAKLFAASKLIDDGQLTAAGKELHAAAIQLQAVRQR